MQNLPDIRNQLNSAELFDAFKRQLTKDFEQSRFSPDFITALEPDYNSILKKIAIELQHNEINLMQLLYRIDISEAQLRSYVNRNNGKNYFYVVAELIIKRVLQKVVLKQYYKNNENS